MDRSIYLQKVSLDDAHKRINQAIDTHQIVFDRPVENIPIEDSIGRITGQAVYAKRSSLHYTASAMDGIAVHSKDTAGASESHPIVLECDQDFVYVNTGQPIPEGFDAVIKIEDVVPTETDALQKGSRLTGLAKKLNIIQSVYPGLNIRNIGEDIVTHQLILPVNHTIRPVDMGALLAGGIIHVTVRKKPRVALIPTGEELVEPDQTLKPGDILDYNSRMLKHSIILWGGRPFVYPVVRDIKDELVKVLQQAGEENDIVVVIAGTSAGSKDFTAQAIQKAGKLLFHGVAIMPGKPTMVGIINNTFILGLPGYPVSFMIAAREFLLPLIDKKLGLKSVERKKIPVRMGRKVVSRLGNEEFLRVKLAQVNQSNMAYPLNRGAGVISSLVEADALVRIPSTSEGLGLKEQTTAELLNDNASDLQNTLIIIGSHDLILDVLKNELQANCPELRLASFHTGSMGGLIALKQDIAHLATSHLLDVKTGKYNLPDIRRLLPGQDLYVVNMAFRQQGMMVAPDNPKKINRIHDLIREDVHFVNRQKGSGTRVLFDYLLAKNHIQPESIRGYYKEEFTHLMIASAVSNQRADAGLGIFSAAKAFDLDFIPLIKERYDFIIPEKYFEADKIKKLLAVIKTEHFKEKVTRLGGYDLSQCGRIMSHEKIN